MASVTWLHLSDWHQKGETFDRKVVRDALVRDIKERCQGISPELEKIDFIVLSGDVAYSGKPEEYAAVCEHLIEPLLEATGVGPERLFIVPGNHDLDRDAFELLPIALNKPFATEEVAQPWLEDDKKRARLLAPFEAYHDFVSTYGGGALSSYASKLQFNVEDKKIALFGFNSALMAARNKDSHDKIDDYGHLIVGEPQIYDFLTNIDEIDLRIAVLHHPVSWLTEFDRDRIKGRLLKDVDCILCGHLHKGEVESVNGTQGECVIIPAGAAYDRRDHANGYNFVSVNLTTKKGTVFLRCWNKKDCWREDVDCATEGKYDFFMKDGAQQVFEQSTTTEPAGSATNAVATSNQRFDPRNPVFYVPYRQKGKGVIGREEVLANLRQQLVSTQQTAIGHAASFQGLGGLGKTQLAVEYAFRYRQEYANGVIWINADQDIESQLIHIAKTAAWISPDSEHGVILEVAQRRLKNVSDCLVVFDNVENFTAIERYLPEPEANPHLLLTSRTLQPNFIPVELPPLNPQQSLEMLCSEARRDIAILLPEEQRSAQGIVDALDGLPLAIEIAGAYLAHIPGCSFQEYLVMLRDNQRAALDGKLLSSFTKHERDLYSTLRISAPVLEELPLLREIVDLLAWSGSAFISLSLMGAILGRQEGELRTALRLGEALRLLNREKGGARYDMHRLVCQVRREEVCLTSELVVARCRKLGDWFEERRDDFTKLAEIEREMDHLDQWLVNARMFAPDEVCRLVWLQAYPPYHWGKFKQAQERVNEALRLLPQKDDEGTLKLRAHIFNDLGSTCKSLGDYPQALEYYQCSLSIRQDLFGESHSETARSLNNVGSAYGSLGDYPRKLEYVQRSLSIQQDLFGLNHSDTATSLNNVGTAYDNLGDYSKALEYFQRSLSIFQDLLGERHPKTANSLNNVGVAYGELGNYPQALEYHRHSLSIRQELLGERHPDTATSLNSVGSVYSDLGDYLQALEYYQRSLSIFQELLGERHPQTANSLNNVGVAYGKLKNYPQALEYYQRSLSIRQELLGERHPDTAASLHNIGTAFMHLRQHGQAVKMYELAIDIQHDGLGVQHPLFFSTLKSLISILIDLRKFPEASNKVQRFLSQLPQGTQAYMKIRELRDLINKKSRSNGFRPLSAKKNSKRKNRKG